MKGVAPQSEGDAAPLAGKAAAMEELALCADALEHVDPLTTEVTFLAVCQQRADIRLGLRRESRRRVWLRMVRGGRHHLDGGRSGGQNRYRHEGGIM